MNDFKLHVDKINALPAKVRLKIKKQLLPAAVRVFYLS